MKWEASCPPSFRRNRSVRVPPVNTLPDGFEPANGFRQSSFSARDEIPPTAVEIGRHRYVDAIRVDRDELGSKAGDGARPPGFRHVRIRGICLQQRLSLGSDRLQRCRVAGRRRTTVEQSERGHAGARDNRAFPPHHRPTVSPLGSCPQWVGSGIQPRVRYSSCEGVEACGGLHGHGRRTGGATSMGDGRAVALRKCGGRMAPSTGERPAASIIEVSAQPRRSQPGSARRSAMP